MVADMIALPAYMSSALAMAKGSVAHSAFNLAKEAVSGAVRLTGSRTQQ